MGLIAKSPVVCHWNNSRLQLLKLKVYQSEPNVDSDTPHTMLLLWLNNLLEAKFQAWLEDKTNKVDDKKSDLEKAKDARDCSITRAFFNDINPALDSVSIVALCVKPEQHGF